MNLRAHAALTLAPVIRGEQSLQHSFDDALNKIDIAERPYFHELIYGCLRHYEWVDAAFKQLVTKKLKNKDADVRALILLGIYQLKFMRTPDHAVISETVTAASKLKKHWAKGFVNGVLRTFTREQTTLESTLSSNDAARYALPQWLLKTIKDDWPNQWQNIAENTQRQAPVTLRTNVLSTTREHVLEDLKTTGIAAKACQLSAQGVSLQNSGDIQKLESLKDGSLSVQDEAAQMAAAIMELAPGQRVLDACAAPGGKTCHILETASPIDVTALELEANRAELIKDNLARLNLKAKVKVCDAADLDSWWDGQYFDRILLDAPCSATGVIRRHPDIKLLRRPDDLLSLSTIQRSLFDTLWQCLAPGGIFVYATCSILKQENEAVCTAFLQNHDDAEHLSLDSFFTGHESSVEKRDFGYQLFPKQGAHDGFFYSKFKKLG